MKIYVLGSKGMLGRYVYTYFMNKNYNVIGLSREKMDVTQYGYDNTLLIKDLKSFGIEENDVIINCIGTIKPMVDKYGTLNAILINSVFPHILSDVCEINNYNLIQITTDCVFSCNEGIKDENTPHDCIDVYGKTKSLGEPENCTVVRTSIIGEEVNQSRSLVEWVKSKKDQKIQGYLNHYWNGLTCLETSKIFEKIIETNNFWKGVRHIHSPNTVNKYELVSIISDIYDLNIDVEPVNSSISCYRNLSSIHQSIMFIPDIETQIIEMKEFSEKLKNIW